MKDKWEDVRVELRRAVEKGDFRRRAEIARRIELDNWTAETQFCGRCGSPMKCATEISRVCTSCGHEIFPQLSPAVVVLVKRGEEALLVHNRKFRNNNHALVAGFVETGESAEDCVRREVKEETSLEIKNVRYIESESWPVPGQLMMGFTAEYAGGEISFADGELDCGGFFSREDMPPVPDVASLSGRIIEAWRKGIL